MVSQHNEIRLEGIHCNLVIEQRPNHVVVLRISGTDIGEFGEAPMKALNEWLDESGPIHFFIDARDVQGASIEVSGEWAGWLSAHRASLKSVTMLTGSRLIQITAEFVRRFASLEGMMWVCTEPAVFDHALSHATKPEASVG